MSEHYEWHKEWLAKRAAKDARPMNRFRRWICSKVGHNCPPPYGPDFCVRCMKFIDQPDKDGR